MRAVVAADGGNETPVTCRLYIRTYGANDELVREYGPEATLEPGARHEFAWRIGDTGGTPVAEIGTEISSMQRADGTVYLDYLTWDGTPDVVLTRPRDGGTMWRRAWVDGVDDYSAWSPEAYRLVQNHGTGLLIQGTREWTDYRVAADVTPHLVTSAGVGARVQGLRRYHALPLCDDGKARLVKALMGTRYWPKRTSGGSWMAPTISVWRSWAPASGHGLTVSSSSRWTTPTGLSRAVLWPWSVRRAARLLKSSECSHPHSRCHSRGRSSVGTGLCPDPTPALSPVL